MDSVCVFHNSREFDSLIAIYFMHNIGHNGILP